MAIARLFRGDGGANYAYVTARVRAKRSFLLPADTWPRLLARDVHEIARTLQEGQYKNEIDELAGRARGAELIERATRLNLGRTYRDILSYCRGELGVMLEAYLARYDVYNVKTLLRGKFSREAPEQIVAELVPAGALPLSRLEQLARLEGLDELVRALGDTPYGKLLQEQLPAGRAPASLLEVENALDRAYYAGLLAGVAPDSRPKKAFREFLEREIDVVNLKTVFRLRGEDVQDLSAYWVEGGGIRVETGQRLLRGKKEDIMVELATLPYWEEIRAGVEQTLDTGSLNPVVTALDRAHVTSADFFGHRYPLSVLPVIDYVLQKRIEVDNLRIIAYGKETGLREQVIEGLIVA